jgi:hypothetical protein
MKKQFFAVFGALMAFIVWIGPAEAITAKKHLYHGHSIYRVHVAARHHLPNAFVPRVPMYCTYRVHGRPVAFLVYDPRISTAWTRAGSPPTTRGWRNITTLVGGPGNPYGNGGFDIIVFGDVPLVFVSSRDVPLPPVAAFFKAVFDPQLASTWHLAPGGPKDVLNAGECSLGQPFNTWDFAHW